MARPARSSELGVFGLVSPALPLNFCIIIAGSSRRLWSSSILSDHHVLLANVFFKKKKKRKIRQCHPHPSTLMEFSPPTHLDGIFYFFFLFFWRLHLLVIYIYYIFICFTIGRPGNSLLPYPPFHNHLNHHNLSLDMHELPHTHHQSHKIGLNRKLGTLSFN